MPNDIHHVHLDTRTLDEPDRFEVWRSYFRRTFLDIPDPARAPLFEAEGDIITSSEGVMFTAGHCEATDNYMSGDISDFILLGSILDGESLYSHADNDALSVTPASGLAMLSPQAKVRVSNHYHRYALIVVPKRLVRARLGFDIAYPEVQRGADRGRSVFTFPRAPIARMLDGMLRLAAQHAHMFDGAAAQTTLNGLVDFALATVQEEYALQNERLPGSDRAWYTAVCTIIEGHLHEPTLDAKMIAHYLGISRSSLYRILADRNETVGHLVRRLRLKKAQRLLSQPHSQISMVAADCGYASAAAFSRAFRSATGMTPRDWQQQARAGNVYH
ncbi:helix-turn-helix transcriptional regulator [Halomonas sp. MCCC 1A11036]|uniref:Helix-turn-helix transcriptional regulator n=1 Tax=Billgrantia zhangzhouensis TaxID=2733481 RepID=A0ABS9AKU2_9GAMM|nr:AraC family transcriptional regulator [Halomonas zhangzhouensis]MCE8022430.1 helix-turn-helix transcriptional regulator [Halomonas zhangzhouensis]